MLQYNFFEGVLAMSSVPKEQVLGLSRHDHRRCRKRALAQVEQYCEQAGLRLTPVRRRTLEILLESHAAQGAYEVLERLSADGLGSKPPVAYRALGFLVEHGFVHRIEKLNAFVACNHPGEPHDPAFMICTDCGAVGECLASSSREGLSRRARESGFQIDSTVVEATGVCAMCAKSAA